MLKMSPISPFYDYSSNKKEKKYQFKNPKNSDLKRKQRKMPHKLASDIFEYQRRLVKKSSIPKKRAMPHPKHQQIIVKIEKINQQTPKKFQKNKYMLKSNYHSNWVKNNMKSNRHISGAQSGLKNPEKEGPRQADSKTSIDVPETVFRRSKGLKAPKKYNSSIQNSLHSSGRANKTFARRKRARNGAFDLRTNKTVARFLQTRHVPQIPELNMKSVFGTRKSQRIKHKQYINSIDRNINSNWKSCINNRFGMTKPKLAGTVNLYSKAVHSGNAKTGGKDSVSTSVQQSLNLSALEKSFRNKPAIKVRPTPKLDFIGRNSASRLVRKKNGFEVVHREFSKSVKPQPISLQNHRMLPFDFL